MATTCKAIVPLQGRKFHLSQVTLKNCLVFFYQEIAHYGIDTLCRAVHILRTGNVRAGGLEVWGLGNWGPEALGEAEA